MKNFSEKLKKALKDKGITQGSLCKSINMTDSGFIRMIEADNVKVKTLEEICEVLEIPITYFLDIDTESKTKYVGFWKQLYEDASEEAKKWKVETFKLREQLQLKGNFKFVSESRGVKLSPNFFVGNPLHFHLHNKL